MNFDEIRIIGSPYWAGHVAYMAKARNGKYY
jgi:hypothetical protein